MCVRVWHATLILIAASVGLLGSVKASLELYLSSRKAAAAVAAAANATANATATPAPGSGTDELSWEWKEDEPAAASAGSDADDVVRERLYGAVDAKLAAALDTAHRAGTLRADFTALRYDLPAACMNMR